jgi:hypothetical protein
MTAMHSLTDSSIATRRLARVVSGVIALAALAGSVQSFAEEPVAAVFKAREVGFFYRSSNSQRPCYALEGRVATILRAVGARDDVKVSVSGCDNFAVTEESTFDRWERERSGSGTGFDDPMDRFRYDDRSRQREQSAHVRVSLMTPVIVTPKILAEIDKDRSRRELVSRVTGNPGAAMNDPIVFAAQRQEVTLSRRNIRLEPEDCELLEQMSTSVFRELDVKVVRRSLNCDSNQPSRIAPQITVEALLPTGGLMPMPEASRSEPKPTAPPSSEPAATDTTPAEIASE